MAVNRTYTLVIAVEGATVRWTTLVDGRVLRLEEHDDRATLGRALAVIFATVDPEAPPAPVEALR